MTNQTRQKQTNPIDGGGTFDSFRDNGRVDGSEIEGSHLRFTLLFQITFQLLPQLDVAHDGFEGRSHVVHVAGHGRGCGAGGRLAGLDAEQAEPPLALQFGVRQLFDVALQVARLEQIHFVGVQQRRVQLQIHDFGPLDGADSRRLRYFRHDVVPVIKQAKLMLRILEGNLS